MTKTMEDPLVRSARREAVVVLVAWICALAYTVTYCSLNGYGRSWEDITWVHLVGGIAFPDWVFWGIVVPWTVCTLFSFWFSFGFMRDDDLGEEADEGQDAKGAKHA